MHEKLIVFIVILVVMSADREVRSQEVKLDPAAFDREVAKIKKLGKNALPVYSTKKGQQGSIKITNGKLESKEGAAMYLAPLGWIVNSSLDLGPRSQMYVLVNVGSQTVSVGEAVLKTGEYAVIRDGKLVKVTAEELMK